ncbi:uncharacterized protein AAG666_008945 [Megaptera novaeangliae]
MVVAWMSLGCGLGSVGGGAGPAAEAASLAVLLAGVGALAAAPPGGHCPCRSLLPSRPLPPPPLPPQPPPPPRTLCARERGAASAPAPPPPPPPPQRPRPPFGIRNFPAPAPLGDSAAAGRGRPGGGARLLRVPGPPRPRHGPGSATAGRREVRGGGAAASCAAHGEREGSNWPREWRLDVSFSLGSCPPWPSLLSILSMGLDQLDGPGHKLLRTYGIYMAQWKFPWAEQHQRRTTPLQSFNRIELQFSEEHL